MEFYKPPATLPLLTLAELNSSFYCMIESAFFLDLSQTTAFQPS